ncbi:MAG TPA: M23 family metallopeptidase [Actinobacteria bacterium]|nr:M23 family metallopeptidase [Actinomycetota bacterium]
MFVYLVVAGLCGLWAPPVDGPVVRDFAPSGSYAGHWGVDLASGAGDPVRAVADGVVTFAGTVAGMQAVTVEHGGLRSTVSFLSGILVDVGRVVARGETVGRSGGHGGVEGTHLSARVGDRYVDPAPLLGCLGPPGAALELVGPRDAAGREARGMTEGGSYPAGHARDPRRHLRSAAHRPPRRRRGGLSTARPRPGDLPPRRRAVAEVGSQGVGTGAPVGDDPSGRRRRRILRRRRS